MEEACRAANLPMGQVLDAMAEAKNAPGTSGQDRDWRRESLKDLIAHIVGTHHRFVREETARLGPLLEKVRSVHGKNHAELGQIQATFAALSQELTMHMMKEERILFPYIERMEESTLQKQPLQPPPFGTVENPVAMMIHEHDSAGAALGSMRRASGGYAPPPEACVSYQTLYRALAEFEADLHQHIHLENNILFPRAVEMERAH